MPDEKDEMDTKAVFRQCVGQVFRVRGIGTNNAYGETDHIELWVDNGVDCDNAGKASSIWVEQEYVEIVAVAGELDQDESNLLIAGGW